LLDFCEAQYGPRDIFRWREGEEIRGATYAGFVREARALAAALAARTGHGAKIAIVGENSYGWLLCWFASLCAGRVAVPLDAQLPTAELLALLKKSGAALLFYAAGYEDAASAFGRAVPMRDVATMLAPYEGAAGWPCAAQPDDLAAILYTSGTTGEPKGVMLSHWNLLSNAYSACRCLDLAGHQVLVVLPLHHIASLNTGMLTQLPGGCTLCLCSIRHFARDLVTFQPVYGMVVPLLVERMYRQIWDAAKKQKKDKLLRGLLACSDGLLKLGIDLRRKLFKSVLEAFGGRLEWLCCGGAAVSDEYVRGFLRFGIEVLPAYGITECAPGIASTQRGAYRAHSGGTVIDCNEVKIVDGEIYVRGDNVSCGYYQDEAATREAFTGDGWHITGDLGYVDGDNYLYVTGRRKNLIILSNGKNVSPEGLENRLMEFPVVKEALVYELDGEIAAELFLDEETTNAAARLEGDLLALNRGLPPYQRITKTVLRDTEFPKTTSKKIIRR
ncbi:MAG: AMP-binding protein, partial [Oscillospiraceae bacterium]|nr:AMP-binding protein [Oscillospiraceae bacterium]